MAMSQGAGSVFGVLFERGVRRVEANARVHCLRAAEFWHRGPPTGGTHQQGIPTCALYDDHCVGASRLAPPSTGRSRMRRLRWLGLNNQRLRGRAELRSPRSALAQERQPACTRTLEQVANDVATLVTGPMEHVRDLQIRSAAVYQAAPPHCCR